MKKALTILLISICLNSFGQKKKLVYQPILNTTLEESFPNAAAIMVVSLKIGIEQFDYGKKMLMSSWYEYYQGSLKHRCKFLFTIDENNTLNIETVDIQSWNSSTNYWRSSSKGLLFKKEEKLKAVIAEGIRKGLADKEITKTNQDWFFKDLVINTLFFENATDLAGDRWFEHYLKDKEVKWEVTFLDIEKNTSANYKYKYKETYAYQNAVTFQSPLSSIALNIERSKFNIVKYTNNDNNVLTRKGDKKELTGFCRLLKYDSGSFYIAVTDQLEDTLPLVFNVNENSDKQQKSVLEVAGKLKELKELLDLGAISEDEFKREKEKLLNN